MVDVASGDARYAIASAISSGSIMRPPISIMRPLSVISSKLRLIAVGSAVAAKVFSVNSVQVGPGRQR